MSIVTFPIQKSFLVHQPGSNAPYSLFFPASNFMNTIPKCLILPFYHCSKLVAKNVVRKYRTKNYRRTFSLTVPCPLYLHIVELFTILMYHERHSLIYSGFSEALLTFCMSHPRLIGESRKNGFRFKLGMTHVGH